MMGAIISGLATITPASAAQGRVAGATGLNIRSCAALDCAVIGTASLGASLDVTGSIINGFYPVRWNGQDGYAFSPYVNNGGVAPWFVEGDVSCRRVALTFNIGIGNTPSQAVLDTLVQKQADATMFPMGWWATAHPSYLRALDAAGFVIGTHGDQAVMLTQQTDAQIRADLSNSVAAIEAVIGRPIDPYHTPYAADTNNRVRTAISDQGFLPVGWNVAAADYGTGITENYVYSRVMNAIYPGAIVEFHLDGPSTPQSTARALPRIIDDLRMRGYELVTVPEMVIPCSTSLPSAANAAVVVNTGGAGVRCRTAPSTSATVIVVLAEGARVPVRGATANQWVPVTCSGQSGWVFVPYLRLETVGSPTPIPSPEPTTPTTMTGTVNNTGGANLRCRSQASTSGAVIASLPPGTVVSVRGSSSNGWTPVVCANQNGFVSSSYLVVSGSPPASGTYARVTGTGGDNLRCRSGPGSSYATITLLPPGTRVDVRGTAQSGWLPIRCSGHDGWASTTYLVIES